MIPAISDTRACACLQCLRKSKPCSKINVDGDDYLASCLTMDVPLGEDTDLLPPLSMTDYRSVVGIIGYASSEFRQDVAWTTSPLSRQFVAPTILDAKRAKAALQYAQNNRVILKYRRGVENLTMVHDGSLGNLDDEKSQRGKIASDEQDWNLGGLVDLLGI
jgi:hypothetical protein